MANGTKRLRIVLAGSMKPMGWIDATLADGSPALYPLGARPLYEVTAPLRARKHFALNSDLVTLLQVGARLHVVEMRKSTENVLRACVVMAGDDLPLGWVTALPSSLLEEVVVVGQTRTPSRAVVCRTYDRHGKPLQMYPMPARGCPSASERAFLASSSSSGILPPRRAR